jgi:NADPH2:quinone reductase
LRAVVVERFGGPEALRVEEVPVPQPGPNQVLIRVWGTAVNYADIKARQGRYHSAPAPPFVPGLELVGQVEAVNSPDPHGIRPGCWVAAFPKTGSYAEYALADLDQTFLLPDVQARDSVQAGLLVTVTAHQVLQGRGQLAPGETVLIHSAAGGVGIAALQLARRLGASTIWASVGHDPKRQLVRQWGADLVLNYRTPNYADAILEHTHGRGVDVIVNPLGGDTLQEDLRCLAPLGRLVVFGDTLGPASLPATALYPNNRAVIGFSFGYVRRAHPERVRKLVEPVMALLAANTIAVPVSRRFRLDDVAQAHRTLESQTAVGKLVIDIAAAQA